MCSLCLQLRIPVPNLDPQEGGVFYMFDAVLCNAVNMVGLLSSLVWNTDIELRSVWFRMGYQS